MSAFGGLAEISEWPILGVLSRSSNVCLCPNQIVEVPLQIRNLQKYLLGKQHFSRRFLGVFTIK